MRNEFNEKWTEMYRTMSKPLLEITELNIKTLNKMAKNSEKIEELFEAKKPEDIFAAQAQLANTIGLEMVKYFQEACGIWLGAATHARTTFTDAVHEAQKTTEKERH
ncbi:MAG: phasin family protein [Gammaproteobacteria bacterium]